MQKKYLVYISSTLEDLKTERRELIKTVTELGAVPITMDGFDITEEKDRRVINKIIEECDYFLNLTAYKGGFAHDNSFTLETEYLHAIKAKVPVIALIVSEKARWKAAKKEKNVDLLSALEDFKKKLEGHVHDKWINLADLKQKALFLLAQEMNLNPRRGWVPSTEAADPSVANELSRLIRENEELKSLLKIDGNELAKKLSDKIKEALKVLAANKISLSFYYVHGENWENASVFSCLRLFRLLAPELSAPRTAAEISHFLGNILNPDLERNVRTDFPTPSNTIKKIMSDLVLLELIKCSVPPPGNGHDEAWEMTEFGRDTFTVYRLRQMKRQAAGKTAKTARKNN